MKKSKHNFEKLHFYKIYVLRHLSEKHFLPKNWLRSFYFKILMSRTKLTFLKSLAFPFCCSIGLTHSSELVTTEAVFFRSATEESGISF